MAHINTNPALATRGSAEVLCKQNDPANSTAASYEPSLSSPTLAATCRCCGRSFQPCRSTAIFCSPRCRVAAQRARDRGTPIQVAATRPGVAADAVLSVTTPIGQKPQGVTLRRKPLKLDPRIVPDPKWPGMYRVRRPDDSLTDMVNLMRAKDALAKCGGVHARHRL